MIMMSIGKEVYGLFSTYSSTRGGAECFTMTLTSTLKTRSFAWIGRVQKLRRSQTHADVETKTQRENDACTQKGQIHTDTTQTWRQKYREKMMHTHKKDKYTQTQTTHTCRRTQKRVVSAKCNHTLPTTTSSRKGVIQY